MEKGIIIERQDLQYLFRPRSLALIGASTDFSRGGGFLWKTISQQGYLGIKYPVNPRYTEIDGNRCYPSVSDIDEHVDLAIIAVPAAQVERALVECARKGIGFAVIHTVGFAEIGDSGKKLQEQILKTAQDEGIRVIGPNCMGIACPDVKLNTIAEVEKSDFVSGQVAFCGQSGWATESFLVEGGARGLKFSTVVSSGNNMDLDLVDYISYFGSDPETKLICAYLEGIRRGREFLQLATRIGPSKPILILKSGFSQAGSRAIMSHTASIAGNKEVWLAAARSSGIVIAGDFEELIDLAVVFSAPLLPRGRKVGIIADSGGCGALAADSCENFGLEVNQFSSYLQEQLKGVLNTFLPPFSGTSNPLDLLWLPTNSEIATYARCVEIIAKEVDTVIIITYYPFVVPTLMPQYISTLCRLRDNLTTPIIIIPAWASRSTISMREFTMAGLPTFASFSRAARAVDKAVRYTKWLSNL